MIANLEYLSVFTKEEQEELLLGEKEYNKRSENNCKTITKKELDTLDTKMIKAILKYLMTDLEVDIEIPFVFETLENSFNLLEEREPTPPIEPERKARMDKWFYEMLDEKMKEWEQAEISKSE